MELLLPDGLLPALSTVRSLPSMLYGPAEIADSKLAGESNSIYPKPFILPVSLSVGNRTLLTFSKRAPRLS